MAKSYIKSRCHSILDRLDRFKAGRLTIWFQSQANQMSPSWKRRRSLATSCWGDCHVDRRSRNGSTNMCRRVVRRICIRNNRRPAHPPDPRPVVMGSTERPTHDEQRRSHWSGGVVECWSNAEQTSIVRSHYSVTSLLNYSGVMIGEGIQSTNQRKHSYVQDRVEVGFFTDPSVCIGCKACEVACKEWNHVPDDGFTWSGNSYDNTGHLGASTWRHVMFLEQDRQKGNQLVGSHSLADGDGEDPFRWVFLSDVCKHCEEAGCLEACP